MDKATLLLQDGTSYVGKAFGARAEASGEMAFFTGVVGCVEKMTDPKSAGRLLLFTFPTIGGYGVIPEDLPSKKISAQGIVVRSWCRHPSNARSRGDVDGFLREAGVPGLMGIDTRALMIKLRAAGKMRALLLQGEVKPDEGLIARAARGTFEYTYEGKRAEFPGEGPRICVMDFGCGEALAKNLSARGAHVTLAPGALGGGVRGGFDAFALSDGPDGQESAPLKLPVGAPVYGEGFGHLLLAKMRGGKVSRMNAMHGGANLPVRWGDRVYITSQFHTMAVSEVPTGAAEVVRNVNDGTVEAILYPDALSVQFQPCMDAGPHDMGWVYDRFLSMAKGASACR